MSGSNQDLDHDFGGDLALGPTGDLATVTGTVLGQQRVLRRLLTNAGDYIWHLAYGAGLPAVIGTPVDAATIEGIVLGQIFLEAAVARSPAPVVEVQSTGSLVSLSITYADAVEGSTQTLGVSLDQ
jgi:hypothetical protein